MQETKITFTVRVADDESRVIITEPTMTDFISFRSSLASLEALQTFRKNGTRSTNTKTKNYDTRKRESAHKETERRRI